MESAKCIAAALAMLCLSACGSVPEWQGWVYPKADDESLSISLAGFNTFEACQTAAIDMMRGLDKPDAAGYECGRSCKWDSGYKANVCKEMRK